MPSGHRAAFVAKSPCSFAPSAHGSVSTEGLNRQILRYRPGGNLIFSTAELQAAQKPHHGISVTSLFCTLPAYPTHGPWLMSSENEFRQPQYLLCFSFSSLPESASLELKFGLFSGSPNLGIHVLNHTEVARLWFPHHSDSTRVLLITCLVAITSTSVTRAHMIGDKLENKKRVQGRKK